MSYAERINQGVNCGVLRAIGASDIDTRLARHVSPPLTTMHVDKMGLGRLAVQLLLNRLDDPAAAPVRAIIRPALIIRHSVVSLSR